MLEQQLNEEQENIVGLSRTAFDAHENYKEAGKDFAGSAMVSILFAGIGYFAYQRNGLDPFMILPAALSAVSGYLSAETGIDTLRFRSEEIKAVDGLKKILDKDYE